VASFPEQGDFMGYFRGRVTFVRYRVDRSVPRLFGPEHLERLAAHVIGFLFRSRAHLLPQRQHFPAQRVHIRHED
jgi:hypothetical protein